MRVNCPLQARLARSHMPKRTELKGEMWQVPKQRARCENTLNLHVLSPLGSHMVREFCSKIRLFTNWLYRENLSAMVIVKKSANLSDFLTTTDNLLFTF